MALSRNFLQKYISILKYLFHDQNQVYMQNLSQISGPVRSFSIWLLFYGLSLLIRPNQHLTKDILSNRSVQEKSLATYITGNFGLNFSNSITKRAKSRKLSKLFQMLYA